MSMEYKAYPLDYERFNAELAPILFHALVTGEVGALVEFIKRRLEQLADPAEGKPLAGYWPELARGRPVSFFGLDWQINPNDPDDLGDLALTAYYNPLDDAGLGPLWADTGSQLVGVSEVPDDQRDHRLSPIILGDVFGPPDNWFNPGKLGSYFRSWETVRRQRETLEQTMARHDAQS